MYSWMSGWVIALSRPSAASSANTMPASFARSSDPSAASTPAPKAAVIAASPGVPGSTTARAALSASRTTAPSSASRADTVLFPEPIPPVSPTRSMFSLTPARFPRSPYVAVAQ